MKYRPWKEYDRQLGPRERDMYNCGQYTFRVWADGCAFHAHFMGPFDPNKKVEDANKEMLDRVTDKGRADFIRGWNDAQKEYLENT